MSYECYYIDRHFYVTIVVMIIVVAYQTIFDRYMEHNEYSIESLTFYYSIFLESSVIDVNSLTFLDDFLTDSLYSFYSIVALTKDFINL